MSGYRSVVLLFVLLWIFCIRSEAGKSIGIFENLTGAVLGQPVDTKHGQQTEAKHVEEREQVVDVIIATWQVKTRYQTPMLTSSPIHQSAVYKNSFLTKLKKIFCKPLRHTLENRFKFFISASKDTN